MPLRKSQASQAHQAGCPWRGPLPTCLMPTAWLPPDGLTEAQGASVPINKTLLLNGFEGSSGSVVLGSHFGAGRGEATQSMKQHFLQVAQPSGPGHS